MESYYAVTQLSRYVYVFRLFEQWEIRKNRYVWISRSTLVFRGSFFRFTEYLEDINIKQYLELEIGREVLPIK